MSDLTIALAGGAIGAVATALLGQAAAAAAAWGTVTANDAGAANLNQQLEAWTEDRTRKLRQQMDGTTNDMAGRGLLSSSAHGSALAEAKANALHEYRDEEWRVSLALEQLAATEGPWHRFWRLVRRRRPGLALTAAERVAPFLDRWREPVTRHAKDMEATVYDRTRRTRDDALRELPGYKLT